MNSKVTRLVGICLMICIMVPLSISGQSSNRSNDPDSLLSLSYLQRQSTTEINAELLKTTDRKSRLMLLLTLGRLAQQTQDTLIITRTYAEAIHLIPPKGSEPEAAFLQLQIAYLHQQHHNLPEAMKVLLSGDSLAALAQNSALRSEVQYHIAEVYRLGNALDKALATTQEAERLGAGFPSLMMQARIKRISVNHQLHAQNPDSAYRKEQARLIAEAIGAPSSALSPADAAQLQCELGSLEQAKGDYPAANAAFGRAAAQYRAIGYYRDYCSVQGSIFEVHRLIATPQEVIRFGKASLDSCAKYDFHDRDHEFLHGIMLAYKKLGQFKEAFEYSVLNFRERQRLDSAYNSERLIALETLYEATKRKEELGRLSSEKTLLETENRNSRVWVRSLLIAGTIVLILLVLLAVLSFWAIRTNARIKEQAQDLMERNQTIARNLEEKEFLFRELHHRVKNNLQLLTSFLTLQISHHPDQLPQDFLSAVEKKIKAMSLVHEQLYRSTEIGQVMLKDYFQDISDHLLGGLGSVLPDLEISIEGDEVQVSVDKAIQLGLIMNEMVTNSLKHAYPEGDQEAIITVQIDQVSEAEAKITLHDNGIGFPEQFDPFASNRVGTRIIVLLARQLGAKLDFFNRAGATWCLQLPLAK
ncbi:MAG: sensor histidine kinase [Bacteroidia bacterium]